MLLSPSVLRKRSFPLLALGLSIGAILPSVRGADAPARPLYLDASQSIEARLDDLLPRLTLEEKVALTHADSKFSNAGVPRLGIPKLWMSDGPHGVREEIGPDTWKPAGRTDDFATWMPVSIALAATWNPGLAHDYAGAIANEARQRNKNIMLGPGLNIQRTPLNGRTFEYLGEDPWLTSRLAVAYVRGMQAGEVAACVKHFAVNNQEVERNSIDIAVDERTLREIYLLPFEATVREAGALSVMGAYNKFRGQFCCHNDYLLNQILKREWGFQGLVISDWNGVHDTREAALHGLDLEMGTSDKPYDEFFLARPFREGLQRGEFPMAVLDDKVRRILRVLLSTRALDGRSPGSLNTAAHQAIARRVAEEGIVLLKNQNGALPLDPAVVKTIAVIGDNATRKQSYGGWSSEIKAFYEITPLEGIIRRVGDHANVVYAPGYRPPVRRKVGAADGAGVSAMETIADKANAADLIERAVQAAKSADVAIVIGGLNHETNQDTEGSDRLGLALPYEQDELIARVTAANPRTVVVLVSGSPVTMNGWLKKVPAVIQAWYSGMEGGNALAAVLFGDVNPSGKLPCTFPAKLADSPAHASGQARHYPGENGVVHYDEGLLVGYRWFDTKQVEPLFPFGHGLSYTQFAYSDLKVAASTDATGAVTRTAEVTLKNTGERAGAEIVQLYVRPDKPAVMRPEKELKAFTKVFLKPGETQTVSLPLPPRAFARYDVEAKGWIADAGRYELLVGASSRDVRLRADVVLEKSIRVP
jgi:beta-glucosidase